MGKLNIEGLLFRPTIHTYTLIYSDYLILKTFKAYSLPFVVNTRSHFLIRLPFPSVMVTSIEPTTLGFNFRSTTTARNCTEFPGLKIVFEIKVYLLKGYNMLENYAL